MKPPSIPAIVWSVVLLAAAVLAACSTFDICDAFQIPTTATVHYGQKQRKLEQQRRRHQPQKDRYNVNVPNKITTLRLGRSPDQEKVGNSNIINSNSSSNSKNPFSSFFETVLPGASPKETEEQREQRLELERLEEVAGLETKRQERVKDDALAYLFLLSLQLLPLVGTDKWVNKLYFLGTAITTVYVGSRQSTVFTPETVSKKSALRAPIGASVAIGLLYALIKFGLDPTNVYAVLVSFYGILGIADISVPLLRNIAEPFELDLAKSTIVVPEPVAQAFKLDPPYAVPVEKIAGPALGVLATALYWSPSLAMEQKFLVSNLIAWSIGMASLGVISLGSFQTGAILLGGLFFYDIFFVFGTDVMMTVALKLEAPVKFLYPAPPSDIPRDYPFSVLGLGDVVIPGIFVRFMTKLDTTLQPPRVSYATATTLAYGAGLLVCFLANEVTNSGQPALLYLDPACVGTALACGVANGQLQEVWDFEDETTASSQTSSE